MAEFTDLYDESPDGTLLRVVVQPGSGETRSMGRHGNALKLRIAAPPEKGRANDAAVKFLADLFETKAAQIELKSGASSRIKAFLLKGFDAETVERRLSIIAQAKGRKKK